MKKLGKLSLIVTLFALVAVSLAGCAQSVGGGWRQNRLSDQAPTSATFGSPARNVSQTVERFQFANTRNTFGHARQTNMITIDRVTRTIEAVTAGGSPQVEVFYVLVNFAIHTNEIMAAASTSFTITNGMTTAAEPQPRPHTQSFTRTDLRSAPVTSASSRIVGTRFTATTATTPAANTTTATTLVPTAFWQSIDVTSDLTFRAENVRNSAWDEVTIEVTFPLSQMRF